MDILEGTPFLVSPSLEYDVELNRFFHRPTLLGAPWNTQAAYARDIAQFLNFLWASRCEKSWRDVTEADHLAYLVWRRRDDAGPRVAGSTWNREVALLNQFYLWGVGRGHVPANPITQRDRRPAPVEARGWRARGSVSGTTPATYAHDAVREKVQWLPPAAYRRWRDVGLRGYGVDGLADSRFRGRWSARNATFTDLMVRTGMRLTEQASLTVFEVPTHRGAGGYQRFWLPGATAKNFSARWIYVPESLVGDLAAYAEIDRAEVAEHARAAGRCQHIRRPLVIEDPARPEVVVASSGRGYRVKVSQLGPAERRRLLLASPQGLEPAAFWLDEDGLPLSVSTWKSIFAAANKRCRAHDVDLHCHAHMLRHTFAVVTLEQLQRGHLAALGEMTPEQRGHYTRIFGDPLDWVRRRLGHASLQTTMVYLHALQELEMQTRMALVPDGWEDPRDTPLKAIGEDPPASTGQADAG